MQLTYEEAKNLEHVVRGISIMKPKMKESNKIRKQFLKPIRRVVAPIDEARKEVMDKISEETKDQLEIYKKRQESKAVSEAELQKELNKINEKRTELFEKYYDDSVEKSLDIAYSESDLEMLMSEINELEKEAMEKQGLIVDGVLNMFDTLEEKKEEMNKPVETTPTPEVDESKK